MILRNLARRDFERTRRDTVRTLKQVRADYEVSFAAFNVLLVLLVRFLVGAVVLAGRSLIVIAQTIGTLAFWALASSADESDKFGVRAEAAYGNDRS